MITVIATTGLVFSLVGIMFIFFQKLRLIGAIDVDSIPAERDAALKDKIIASRMKRKIHSSTEFLKILLEPLSRIGQRMRKSCSHIYLSLIDVRERHRVKLKIGGSTVRSESDPEEQSEEMGFAEGIDKLLTKAKVIEAEKRCIALFEHDTTSIDACRGLLKIYKEKKESDHAQDMAKYLTKLSLKRMRDASPDEHAQRVSEYTESMADLAEIAFANDDTAAALAAARQALKYQENNPKYLDLLVHVHVARKERLKAEKAVALLEKANPDNQKIDEFEKKIAELSY